MARIKIELGPFKDRQTASKALNLTLRTYPMDLYETAVGTPLDMNGNYWVRGTRLEIKDTQ